MSLHQVKVIGVNGQVSLGKEFAGKMVLIDQVSEGIWVIKAGEFIPDSEKWLRKGNNLNKLEKALQWAEKNKSKGNFKKIIKGMQDK